MTHPHIPTTPSKPKPGQYLFASCSAEDYGRIISIGEDANGVPDMDIEVFEINRIIFIENCNENEGTGYGNHALTYLELETPSKVIMRDLQWKDLGDGYIECNTPGNGCYRCTKLFKLKDYPYGHEKWET